ncbi:hypothetical protein [Nitratireductor sp. XY-223]|uniref:COG1470 family protein n=1 Tax=Nitratireductor sp. XY-223 TaxID=2561926 RepID=UPI0010AB234E|nr:hypothetical protein [Nitratireductor sp. XY-223]
MTRLRSVVVFLTLLLVSFPATAQSDGQLFRLRDTFVPGTSGNQVIVRIQNLGAAPSPDFAPQVQGEPKWVAVTSIDPPMAQLAPGAFQDFLLTFDIAADAPPGSSEAVSIFFNMGVAIPSARFDLVADFVERIEGTADVELPDLEDVEIHDSFKAGSTGNAVVFRVENTTAFPVTGLNLRPELPAQYLTLDSIDPQDIDLEPGETVEITAAFSVRPDADVGEEDVVGFHFDTRSDSQIPIPRYRLIATIDEGEEIASCNSAVDSGGDEGGGVEVDLGGFTGKAGFSWQMHDIKDQMDVTVGSVSKTTGCVSGTGTFEFDVQPGARTARVKVTPNCEDTSGTAWSFTFECPLESEVTADGQGNAINTGGATGPGTGTAVAGGQPGVGGPGGQLTPGTTVPTAAGQPVVPAAPPPNAIAPSGVAVGEAETNNDPASATPINPGDTVTGTIGERGDWDFYAVSLAHQGELTVAFPQVPPGINIAFRVLDSNGSQVWGWQGATDTGVPFSGWVDLKVPGDYLIEVRDGSSNAFSASPYTLVTSFIPTADTGEPNDTFQDAKPLEWNHAIRANILPRGDWDHYRVEADRLGQITVDFRGVPDEVNMAFRVLDANGGQVWGWQGASTAGETYKGTADLPKPGTYVIEVRDGSSNARSAVPYEMVASFDPAYDAGEPNNDHNTATPVGFGTQVWANILPRGDWDHYLIDAPHQGELTVDFNAAPDELNMAFRVLDSEGGQVWGWQGASTAGELFRGWADLKSPGQYVVEVRDGSSNARSHQPYGVVISFLPTADTAEPNDVHADATPLALGDKIQSNILPRGDWDHYSVNVPALGQLNVDFPVSPPELNMTFRVLNADGSQVWGWQGASSAGELFRGWADLSSAGTYIVEVRDGSSNARAIAPYEVKVTLDAAADDAAEPNGSVATATPIASGNIARGSILPRGDQDFYAFASQTGTVSVEFVESPTNLNMAFRVLDPGGSQVVGWQGASTAGQLFAGKAELPGPGRYVLEVRDGSSNARSPAAYAFVLRDL